MIIDLLSIYEKNQEIKKQVEEIKEKKELNELIGCILNGEETFTTDIKELLEKIGLKYKKNESYLCYSPFTKNGLYEIKLNKTNIKKIQEYIDREGK